LRAYRVPSAISPLLLTLKRLTRIDPNTATCIPRAVILLLRAIGNIATPPFFSFQDFGDGDIVLSRPRPFLTALLTNPCSVSLFLSRILRPDRLPQIEIPLSLYKEDRSLFLVALSRWTSVQPFRSLLFFLIELFLPPLALYLASSVIDIVHSYVSVYLRASLNWPLFFRSTPYVDFFSVSGPRANPLVCHHSFSACMSSVFHAPGSLTLLRNKKTLELSPE